MSQITPNELSTLQAIRLGTVMFITQADGMEMFQKGLINIDAQSVDPANPQAYGVSLTDAAIQQLDALGAQQTAQQPAATAPVETAPVVETPAIAETAPVVETPVATAPEATATQAPANAGFPTEVAQTTPAVETPVQTAPEATATEAPAATTESDSPFKILTGIPRPKRRSGGNAGGARKSKYKYDELAVDACFFVPDSSFDGKNAQRSMLSSVAQQNKKYRVPKQVGWNPDGTPQYQIAVDGNGQPLKAKDGSTMFVMIQTKKFSAHKVEAGTPGFAEGGSLVYRDALKETDKHLVDPTKPPAQATA